MSRLKPSQLKSRFSRTRTQKRPAHKSCPGFLQWLRGRVCALAHLHECSGRMTAAHVDHAGDKGMATKASDRFAIPLCEKHATLQHTIGWRTFEAKYLGGVDRAVAMADEYFRAWPGRLSWLKKLAGAAE